jgi:hypothetical protein
VHIHADLIAGLPGENIESFGQGFDQLIALRPQEIQVGILKRLKGTPIVRHDTDWDMVYDSHPPYEILQNKLISFPSMQKIRRFARYWDLIGNSGNFVETAPLLWSTTASPFGGFMRFSEWIYREAGRRHGIALHHLMEFIFKFLTAELGLEPAPAAQSLWRDYQRGGRSDRPLFLRDYLPPEENHSSRRPRQHGPKRQARHLAETKTGKISGQ